MKNLLRNAVQIRRQNLINKLIKSGIYKKNNKHLYEMTLSDLETEFESIHTNVLVSNSEIDAKD